jgi:outer membrane receptor protein involved in Fe transport
VEPPEAAKVVSISNIRLERTEKTLQVILETTQGTLTGSTRQVGNSTIIDIPNAVLSLPSSQEFQSEAPFEGIASVTVKQLDPNTVQVAIAGTKTIPMVRVQSTPNGLQLSLNQEQELQITVIGDEQLSEVVPKIGISREIFSNRSNRRLGEIFRTLPGVTIEGPPGESNDVRLRGVDKEFTRTQIDGLTLPDGGEKREFQANRLPSFFVEDVTIIRNPTAELETDGIAGRIGVKTRSLPESFFFEGRGAFGGQNALNGDWLNLEAAIGDRPTPGFAYFGGVSILKSPITVDKLRTSSTGATETEREDKTLEFTDFALNLGFPYDRGEVQIKPLLLQLDNSKDKFKLFEEPKKAATQEQEIEQDDRRTIGVSVSHQHNFASGASLETIAGAYETTEDKDKTKLAFKANNLGLFVLDKTTLEQEDKSDATYSLRSTLTIPIETGLRQEIKLGASLRWRDRFRDKIVQEVDSKGRIRDVFNAKDTYSISENYLAAFIQDEIWLGDRFSILPGVRIERVNLTSEDSTGREGEKSITDVNPSLHLLYRATDDLSLRVAISKGVNRPKFDELSPFEDEKNERITIGNPDLDPARSLNLDVGAEYETKYLSLGANFFYRDITGVIEEVDTGLIRDRKRIFQVQNVGDGWTSGFELEQRLNLGFTKVKALEGLTLRANQTFLDSELTDANGLSRPFKEQPSFIANLGLDYNYEPWGTTFSLGWTYVSDRTEIRADGGTKVIEPASFMTLAVRQRITPNLSLFFEGTNLTNSKKVERETLANGNTTRRSEDGGQTFLLGINWKF